MENCNNLNIEKHPNWYYDIPLMNTLILGSFPPHVKRRGYEFYYPNKKNHFWRILAALDNNNKLSNFKGDDAVSERKQIMERLNIGVQNMGKTISRIEESALDKDITIIEYNDIMSILKKHTELKLIILPGFDAKSSTYQSFCNYLRLEGIEFLQPIKPSHRLSFSFTIENRKINCVICTSTSTATRKTLDYMIEEFKGILE